MSVDAVAVLRVDANELRALLPPPAIPGTAPHLVARGDATLFHLFVRYDAKVAELAAALRRLGPALARHVDPRGVAIFPDTSEPRAHGYDAIVAEVQEVLFWIPLPLPQDAAPLDPRQILELAEKMRAAASDPAAMAEFLRAMHPPDDSPRPGLERMRKSAAELRQKLPPELREVKLEPSPQLQALLDKLKKG